MYSPAELQDLRNRVLSGEQLTPEIYRNIVASLRGQRVSAAETAAAKPKGKAKVKSNEALSLDLDAAIAALDVKKESDNEQDSN